MQERNTFPETRRGVVFDIGAMADARKNTRQTTPTEFRELIAGRIRDGREKIGYTVKQISAELSRRAGRDIPSDTYRKWETIESTIALDVIAHFCDLTRVHILDLLDRRLTPRDVERIKQQGKQGKAVA